MCRLLGVLTNDTKNFGLCLRDAPRSLAMLSPEHPDGWGIAAWEPERGWLLRKRSACAQRDGSFAKLAEETRGQVLVAHIRQRTVGAAILENTHPFRSGRWSFAHNGTIDDVGYLRRRISEARWMMIRGSTDSELLFAFLLTCLDEGVAAEGGSDVAVDSAIDCAMDELARAPARSLSLSARPAGRDRACHRARRVGGHHRRAVARVGRRIARAVSSGTSDSLADLAPAPHP